MEIFMLRNHLAIPPDVRGWIRMAHYEGLDFTPKTDAPTSESITKQRLRLRETQKLNALLRAEAAQNEATLSSLRALVAPGSQTKPKEEPTESDAELNYPVFKFLQDKGELTGDASYPVSQTTAFVLSQLPSLKPFLGELGPRLEALKLGQDGKAGFMGEAEKGWRRERSEFVETEMRRHLEQVRGLELGEMGDVRDGEWQGDGRNLQKGEVEELEKVVGLVGGSRNEKEKSSSRGA
ncbi:mind kinetochore complex component [Phlyctema vagabunda]|uniref:Mind kinetochore complex component n=1 Tax=Phlyctema vagabunda TaxID=108571 RepID=A0ABR4PRH5_9HELO